MAKLEVNFRLSRTSCPDLGASPNSHPEGLNKSISDSQVLRGATEVRQLP